MFEKPWSSGKESQLSHEYYDYLQLLSKILEAAAVQQDLSKQREAATDLECEIVYILKDKRWHRE